MSRPLDQAAPRASASGWSNLPLRVKGLIVVAIPLVPLLIMTAFVRNLADADLEAVRGIARHRSTSAVPAANAAPRSNDVPIAHVLAITEHGLTQMLSATTAGAGFSAAGFCVAMWLFTTAVARRIDRARDNADRLAQSRPLDSLAPADDEVGRLSAHLHEAAHALEKERRERDAAEAALRDYAERTQDLYDRAPCGYHSLDPSGHFITINQTELDWLGYTREEVIGRLTFADLLTPASRERFAVTFPLLQQTGEIRDVEFELHAKSGRMLPVSVSSTVVRDATGAFMATRSSVFDITDRKAIEEARRLSEARLAAILHTVADGLLIVSAEGEMSYWNPAAERLLGLTTGAMAVQRLTPGHWRIFDTAGEPLAFEQWPLTRVLMTGRDVIGEQIRVERGDGGDITLSISVAPLRDGDGRVIGAVASFDDVTDRRLAAETLAHAKAEAERANRAKSDFLSRVSHDLRTPLNAMIGFAQLLEAEPDSDARRDAASQILKGGEHLLGLINEVLDIGRIESGQLSLSSEPLAVLELVQQTIDLVQPIAAQHGVTLVGLSDEFRDAHVVADRQKCHQVLLNLVSNAVKYNRPGGRVTLSATESRPGHLRISVTDTGAGIRQEKLASMFRPFERLGAERTSIEGTGLGLALSKGLVEAMGGAIGVESIVDSGSTFWVEFPLTQRPVRAPTTQPGSHPLIARTDPLIRGDVLYIEDNMPNVRLIQRLLAKRPGVRLRTVAQGRLGLEQVRADPPDLVLLDLHLPDLPGEEVLRLLWETPSTRDVPVAVLSADATPSRMKRLRASGAIAYLTKPLDLAAVLGLIDDVLRTGNQPANG